MNTKVRVLVTLLVCLLGSSVSALGLWGVFVVLAEIRDEATRATERFALTLRPRGHQGHEIASLLIECADWVLQWFRQVFLRWLGITPGT